MVLALWAVYNASFEKLPFVIFLLFDIRKPLIFLMSLLMSTITKAYLCPNMINFDGVDFSEYRSEVVVRFFLMLSVQILYIISVVVYIYASLYAELTSI